MSARGLQTLACRRRRELTSFCASVLPGAAESLCDTSTPSTSGALHEQAYAQLRWTPSPGQSLAVSGWRSVHHEHKQCGEQGHQHEHRTAPQRRPVTLEELEKACWSCEKLVKRGGLVCNGCETIQPPDDSLNYFELFSLPATFDLSPQLLERRYKALQWNLHPDKMGHKPAEEREFSAKQASVVNLAYSILKSPLARANYMLALRGISAGEHFEGTIEDPELLMEVLEAREEVEGTDDPATLSALLARNRQQQERLVAALSAAFRSGDTRGAVALTHQLQYVTKLEQEIVKKLPQL
ncbi:hypothetical protein PLESTB_000910100 [Pleodorina starrii]|uniref:J domain-containing protein n=1 Tax=Pleodorina starrii TaxID=330485 RepID=A0A9W6BMB6_9CHLO|nr:hypothetical protein PLESTM_001521600 [Pleodorina starrii]GLC54827.1 hypothetical protein PLESTB_000910100 [Pleodorina starrii]GLC73728.1 hypothetical protein PLESTF_001412900 [Pleodorina starrii]